MKTIIIDNYDSFTYNLAHAVRQAGAEVTVVRNDKFDIDSLDVCDNIILSPGPGIPGEAGKLLDVIRRYNGRKPILGVCLGHQAIAEAFGGTLTNLTDVCHGVQTPVEITVPDTIFSGLPQTIDVGRYHSWVVNRATLPSCLEVTALSPEGYIMALRHRTLKVHGIQFHPESVLTPLGMKIIENFLTDGGSLSSVPTGQRGAN